MSGKHISTSTEESKIHSEIVQLSLIVLHTQRSRAQNLLKEGKTAPLTPSQGNNETQSLQLN